jgi:FtsZ-binding cell division protein ZapB
MNAQLKTAVDQLKTAFAKIEQSKDDEQKLDQAIKETKQKLDALSQQADQAQQEQAGR